jgi:hypothetical protein
MHRNKLIKIKKRTTTLIIKKYNRFKIWNEAFIIKNELYDYNLFYLILFFKDIKRFHLI